MAQIKATIELLLRILRENGTTKVAAETFRQAKFDNGDAVWFMNINDYKLYELSYEYDELDLIWILSVSSIL